MYSFGMAAKFGPNVAAAQSEKKAAPQLFRPFGFCTSALRIGSGAPTGG